MTLRRSCTLNNNLSTSINNNYNINNLKLTFYGVKL